MERRYRQIPNARKYDRGGDQGDYWVMFHSGSHRPLHCLEEERDVHKYWPSKRVPLETEDLKRLNW